MQKVKHPAEIAKDFREYRFFKGFSESLILQICTLTQVELFRTGENVLVQGQDNENLYFLNQGELDVLLDGEIVTHLSVKGEVLGEMSVISHLPVSSTLKATQDVECYKINVNNFSYVSPREKDHFQFLLYKIYSSIVVDRLRATNQKARQFEITNRELLRTQDELKQININLERMVQERTEEVIEKAKELEVSYLRLENQNIALSTGFKKISELNQVKTHTVSKLKSFNQIYLTPLEKNLTSIKNSLNSDEDKAIISNSILEVQELENQIETLLNYFDFERELEKQRVLFIECEKKQQLVAKMALGGTGVTLDIAGDEAQGREFIKSQNYDLVVCNINSSEILHWLHESKLNIPIVVLTGTVVQSFIEPLLKLNFVNNVVSRDSNNRSLTAKNFVTAISKILTKDYFGIEKYLSWGVDIHERILTNSNQRESAIQAMCEQLKKLGIRSVILDRCSIIVEELLMNAIYDAPVSEKGEPLFNHLGRKSDVALTDEQACTLRFACDGTWLAVSVVDPFGALPKKIILNYLKSCYEGQAGVFNQEKGGAGRGLHQIIENSDLAIFNVQSKIKTEVIALINIDASAKEDHSEPSLNYFFF